MRPTDDQIAVTALVAVLEKVATLKLELDANALPLSSSDFAHCLAIGIEGLDMLDDKAETIGEHAEEKNDPGSFVGAKAMPGRSNGAPKTGRSGRTGPLRTRGLRRARAASASRAVWAATSLSTSLHCASTREARANLRKAWGMRVQWRYRV